MPLLTVSCRLALDFVVEIDPPSDEALAEYAARHARDIVDVTSWTRAVRALFDAVAGDPARLQRYGDAEARFAVASHADDAWTLGLDTVEDADRRRRCIVAEAARAAGEETQALLEEAQRDGLYSERIGVLFDAARTSSAWTWATAGET